MVKRAKLEDLFFDPNLQTQKQLGEILKTIKKCLDGGERVVFRVCDETETVTIRISFERSARASKKRAKGG